MYTCVHNPCTKFQQPLSHGPIGDQGPLCESSSRKTAVKDAVPKAQMGGLSYSEGKGERVNVENYVKIMFEHDKSTYTQLEKEIKLLIQGDRISSVKNLHPNMMSQFMNLLSNTVHWNVLASALCTQGRPIFDGLTRMLRMLAPVRSFHHKKRYD
jgi:hypothetical protein